MLIVTLGEEKKREMCGQALDLVMHDNYAEIKESLIGFWNCVYLHEKKDSQGKVDRSPWWGPL